MCLKTVTSFLSWAINRHQLMIRLFHPTESEGWGGGGHVIVSSRQYNESHDLENCRMISLSPIAGSHMFLIPSSQFWCIWREPNSFFIKSQSSFCGKVFIQFRLSMLLLARGRWEHLTASWEVVIDPGREEAIC